MKTYYNRVLLVFFIVIQLTGLKNTVVALSPFKMVTMEACKQFSVNRSFTRNASIPISAVDRINSLSFTGKVTRKKSDFIVRITLKDTSGREHLVMEAYNELYDSDSISFEGFGEESLALKDVRVDSLCLYIKNAVLFVSQFKYVSGVENTSKPILDVNQIKIDQIRKKVDFINGYNKRHNKLWRAGITELALESYETKKHILGLQGNASSGGFEYYIGGIYEVGDVSYSNNNNIINNDGFVESFDWRNRHGKNWITSIKHQGTSNYCAAFAAVAAIEAVANLYYNQQLNLDLSEQEAACCCGAAHPAQGMLDYLPVNYIRYHGVCDESSYPFDPTDSICRSDDITPSEIIRPAGSNSVTIYNAGSSVPESDIVASIKMNLIKYGPLASGILSGIKHAMLIVGYGKIKRGDVIRVSDHYGDLITIGENDPRIGATYWIFKNSYGLNWSYTPEHHGYVYVLFSQYRQQMVNAKSFVTPLYSQQHNDSDVRCVDLDGDGYYNWGIGQKPVNCPENVPDEPDGDDSNPDLGPIDEYGFCQILNSDTSSVYIDSSQSMDSVKYFYGNV